MAFNYLGMPFIMLPVEELQRLYEEHYTVCRVVSVDFNEPYKSIVHLVKDEARQQDA